MRFDSCVSFHDTNGQVDWKDVKDRLKPGAHILAICPMLHHHTIAAAIEDSGVEIRDSILLLNYPTYLITLGRVPLEGRTVAENVLRYGTGALNIDISRIEGKPWKTHRATGLGSVKFFTEGETPVIQKEPNDLGRWPSNVIISENPTIKGQFPDSKGARSQNNNSSVNIYQGQSFNKSETRLDGFREWYNDSGSASRFYHHVSVEDPLGGLAEYLAKLVTREGGEILTIGVSREIRSKLIEQGFSVTNE